MLRRRIGRFIGLEKGCNGVLGWKYERQLQVIRNNSNNCPGDDALIDRQRLEAIVRRRDPRAAEQTELKAEDLQPINRLLAP